MREIQRKEIDGHQYVCTQMSVRKAHQTFIELVATLGQPIVVSLSRGYDEDKDASDVLTTAASMMMMNLSRDVSDRLLANVFDGVLCDGIGKLTPWDGDFEDHFHGRIFSMYKVWAWGIEVNYRDFLDAAQSLGLVKMAKEMGKSAFQSRQTQTGESGESSPQSTTPSV